MTYAALGVGVSNREQVRHLAYKFMASSSPTAVDQNANSASLRVHQRDDKA